MSSPKSRKRSFVELTSKVAFTEIESLFKGIFLSKDNKDDHLRQKQERIAEIIVSQMGQLKGTGLKLLQVLSLDESLLPKIYIKKFEKSYSGASELSRVVVKKIIKTDLGDSPEKLFKDFDYRPIASASIGQVHRATLTSGEKVAVKIQYPNIAEQTEFDVAFLQAIVDRFSQPLLKNCIAELSEQLREEVNYPRELKNAELFYNIVKHESVETPRPYHQLSSGRVLTMSFLEGTPFADLTNNPEEISPIHLQLSFDFFFYSLFNHEVLHTDPHPGNYILSSNNRLGVVDFGSVKNDIPREVVELFQLILSPKASKNSLISGYEKLGARISDADAFFADVIAPYREGCLSFLHQEQVQLTDHSKVIRSLRAALFGQIQNEDLKDFSAEFTMIHKSFLSLLLMLIKLRATISTKIPLTQR